MEDSTTLPIDVYHGVPQGWSREAILAAHRCLSPSHELLVPLATEPGAPSWLPDRNAWLQYRASVRAICEGIRNTCPACIELGIKYIELDYVGSYSGYLKERLASVLGHAPVGPEQAARLLQHFESLAKRGQRRYEWRQYEKLASQLCQKTTNKANQSGTP